MNSDQNRDIPSFLKKVLLPAIVLWPFVLLLAVLEKKNEDDK